MSFALVDVGGSFIKTAIVPFDTSGQPLSAAKIFRRPTPEFLDPRGERREIDPVALRNAIFETLAEAERAMVGVDKPRDIFVTGQMAGLAITDPEGQPIAPIVSWQDQRGRTPKDARREISSVELRELGEGLRIGLPLLKLPALHVPRKARVTSLIGFVCDALAGRPGSVIHATDAASWGMINIRTRDWSDEGIAFANVYRGQLPDVSWDVMPVGNSREFGWRVWCALGDQQASLLGAGLGADEVSINLATGCQVSVRAQSMSSEDQIQTRPFFRGEFLHTRTHLPGGRLMREAIVEAYGSAAPGDWKHALKDLERGHVLPPMERAIKRITSSLIEALSLIDPYGKRDLLWSGGVGEHFETIRQAVLDTRTRASSVSSVSESSLNGLARIALEEATS